MGKVIGKQGATIKDIRSQTGANIQVQEKPPDKCEFTIRGTGRQVQMAKNTILDIADQHERQGDRSGGDARGGGNRDRDDDWRGNWNSGNNNNSKGKVVDDSMEYPLDLAGRIIGSRGSQIAEIRQQSGAQCHVDKLEKCCVVRISGTPDQVDHARDLVKRAVDNGGPPAPPPHPSRREEIMEVPPNQMGRIIGKGGETVKQLQYDSGAKIDINTKEQPDIVRLSGSDDAIAHARNLINDILQRSRESQDGYGSHGSHGSYGSMRSDRSEETLEVPPTMIGRIIGKGGEMIQQLQSDSGAKIQIDKDRPGCVYLSGPSEAVGHAKRLILELRDAEGRSNDSQRRPARAEEVMSVPSSSMGRIIGKGGETISQLQKDSGAKIDINKDEPGVVRLSGSSEDVAYARRLIQDLVNNDNRNPASRQPARHDEVMNVPADMMGRIIGKGGEKIMQLQQESGAKIDIRKEEPGVVRLSGSGDQIDCARRLILDIVEGGGKGSGKSRGSGYDDGPQTAESMEIPQTMVQHVVGKDGDRLRTLERESGVQINIDTKDGVFKLQINGSKKGIEHAQSLILDSMEQASINAFDGPPRAPAWDGGNSMAASGSYSSGGSYGDGAPQQWPPAPPAPPPVPASMGGPPWQSADHGGKGQWQAGDHGNAMQAAQAMYGKGGGGPWHGYPPQQDFHRQKRERSSSSSSSSSEPSKRKAAKKKGRDDRGQGRQQEQWPQAAAAWPQAAPAGWPQSGAWGAGEAAATSNIWNEIDQDEL